MLEVRPSKKLPTAAGTSRFAAPQPHAITALALCLLAAISLAICVAITCRAYMPCPYYDEWEIISHFRIGERLFDGPWLWSQHGEHRIVIPRLLIGADLSLFGGRRLSLFSEIYLVQIAQASLLCWVIKRNASWTLTQKLALQSLYVLCLFHPNQAQNFVWAFQISFVLPFLCSTLVFLGFAYWHDLPPCARVTLGFLPIIAALNLASGLLIWPVLLAFGLLRRLPARYLLFYLSIFLAFSVRYVTAFQPREPTPLQAILHPGQLILYVGTLLGASFSIIPLHVLLGLASVAVLAGVTIYLLRNRQQLENWDWFCLTNCYFLLGVATLAAVGRFHYGVAQAHQSRYQTPAMMYWASLFNLILIVQRRRQPKFVDTSWLLIPAAVWALMLIPDWQLFSTFAHQLTASCRQYQAGAAAFSDLQTMSPEAPQQAQDDRTYWLRTLR